MTRLPRLCPAGMPLHVIQRGNNRQICFACEDDYQIYLEYLHEGANTQGVDIHAWVLMTNHVHLLGTSKVEGSISRMMQYVGRHYVRYFNRLYNRTGTLWEGRFNTCLVDSESYFFVCQRYIELNPVRAGIVTDPAAYQWSSYRTNALGFNSNLITPHSIYSALGASEDEVRLTYRSLFSEVLELELINDLRASTNSCMAFGGSRFKKQIEDVYQRRVEKLKPGPKSEG